ECIMKIPCNPFSFFYYNQLGNPFVCIFQLAFEFFAFVAVIGIEWKQNNTEDRQDNKRQLGHKQVAVEGDAECHCCNGGSDVNAVNDKKSDFVADIPYKKRHENCKINVTEKISQHNVYSHFNTDPYINEAASGVDR